MFETFRVNEEKINYIKDTRSRLFSLQPIGLGTAMKESMISYITRLSEAHCTEVGSLISYECSPIFKNSRIYRYSPDATTKVSGMFYKDAYTLNCFGSICLEMEDALTRLTQRSDIFEMNLNKWTFLPANRTIVKKTKHWCSQCYFEWEKEGEITYDPLIWSIDLIKICAVHKILLQTCCPACNKEIPIIHYRSMTSHCVYCFKTLVKTGEARIVISEEELLFQMWLCDSVGKMLISPYKFGEATSIFRAIHVFREEYCDSNDRVLSRILMLENKRRQINAYCRGDSTPTFNVLLWVCYVLGMDLVRLCTDGKLILIDRKPEEMLHRTKKYFMLERTWSKIDKEFLRKKLMDYMSEDCPRSFAIVSRELGINESNLRKIFPEEAQMLSKKYSGYRNEKRKHRIQMIKIKMGKYINEYYEVHQTVPNTMMLKKLMGSSHITFNRELMNHYHGILEELLMKRTKSDDGLAP